MLLRGKSKSRYFPSQFQTRYFSPASPADTGEGVTEGREFDRSSAAARQSRHKMLRKRRQKLKQGTAVMKRHDMESRQSSLPKYQRADFAHLFDRIVPQHSLAKVDELIRNFEQAVKDTTIPASVQEKISASSKKKRVTKKKVEVASSLPLLTVLRGMLNATNPNNRLQVQVLEFVLLTTHKSSTVVDGQPPSPEYMEQVLIAARERAIRNSLSWSVIDAREHSALSRESAKQQLAIKLQRHAADKGEAGSLIVHLMDSLPPKNYRSLCSLFESYVGGVIASDDRGDDSIKVRLLGDGDDDECVETTQEGEGKGDCSEDAAFLSGNEEAEAPIKPVKLEKPFVIRKLSSHIDKRAGGSHYHLVAQVLARFFFLDDELARTDKRFTDSHRRWNDSKDKFVAAMMKLQETLHRGDSLCNGTGGDEKSAFESEDDDSEAIEEEVLTREGDVISIDDTEIDISVWSVLPPTKENKEKRRRRSHLAFEAIPLLQETRTAHDILKDTLASKSPLSRMVFVDNLPIDIKDDVIKDVFSRCGDLVSIDIFNRRPDLDPGPLSKADIISRRKLQMQSVGVYSRRWQRPCTPVYGLLAFADEDGYKKAIEESLRIFGMLVEKHPVRSIPASDMTRLYLESVPDGYPCLDFEYQLGQLLDPDLFVCLDAGQNNQAMVGSCEIKFPSFEVAYASYQKLRKLDILQDNDTGCTLNWKRSPRNAILWWSRKLGFD